MCLKNPGSILEMVQVLLEMERALHPDADTPPAHSMMRYFVRQTVFHAAGQADQLGERADVLVAVLVDQHIEAIIILRYLTPV